MAEYLVEAYCPSDEHDSGGPAPEEIAEAAAKLTGEGQPVRLLLTIVVPDDETCFYFFEAASGGAVLETAKRAGLRFERFVEAVSATPFPVSARTDDRRDAGSADSRGVASVR